MNLSDDSYKELNKYTKEDLIIAIKKNDYRGNILRDLRLIKYYRICDVAEELAKKAKDYGDKKQYSLSNQYYDQSSKLYDKAFEFMRGINHEKS